MEREKLCCSICAKVFKSASTLRIHRRIHVAEKKYRCEQCNMRFHQKINLKHHLNVHANKQPYRCDFCNKGFVLVIMDASHQSYRQPDRHIFSFFFFLFFIQ